MRAGGIFGSLIILHATKTYSILIKYLTNFSDDMLLNHLHVESIMKPLSVTFDQVQF